jgi:hypothetical protein
MDIKAGDNRRCNGGDSLDPLPNPSPERIDHRVKESPLENEHTGSARIYYSPCVIRRRPIVTPAGNDAKLKKQMKK